MIFYRPESDFSELINTTGIKGDFTSLLWNGFVTRDNNQIVVERFGADVPPIYIDFADIIITDAIKQKIVRSDLCGFEFCEVKKHKIIKGDWKNFTMDFFEPYDDPTYDPIKKGKHCPETADLMPKLWVIQPLFELKFKKISHDDFEVTPSGYADFYQGAGDKIGIFISPKAKSFFESLGLPLTYLK